MKVLKNIAGAFALLFGFAVIVGIGYIAYIRGWGVPNFSNSHYVEFDKEKIDEFDKWSREDEGEPDVIFISGPGEYDPNKNYKVYDPDDPSTYDIDHVIEVFGVDPNRNLIEEGVTSIAFSSAGYGNDNILVGHGRTFIRNIHTGELDYYVTASKHTMGQVGNYKLKTIWLYQPGIHNEGPVAYSFWETHESYKEDQMYRFKDLYEAIIHWDGEGDIIFYNCTGGGQKAIVYDIELNPELDDSIFTPESLVKGVDWSNGKVKVKEGQS